MSATYHLLSVGSDSKTIKGEQFGYLTGILYLAPANESGVINTCSHATDGCKAVCLFKQGMASAFASINVARVNKTKRFASDKEAFLNHLAHDILKLCAQATAKGLKPCVRLNGTSDINWHKLPVQGRASIMELFSNVQFYDYTKIPAKALAFAEGKLPANYHVTFSRAETEKNHQWAAVVAKRGGNVAVVFRNPEFPAEFAGRPVINGDESDLRFLDGKGVIVGLKAKGSAKRDHSGFVVSNK